MVASPNGSLSFDDEHKHIKAMVRGGITRTKIITSYTKHRLS